MEPTNLRPEEWQVLLNSILENTSFGLIVLDHEGNFILANRLALDLLDMDLSVENSAQRNILSCLVSFPSLRDQIKSCLQGDKKPFEIESGFLGSRYLNIRGRPIVHGYLITIENITDQKEIEAISINSLIAAQENERTRLAREIHDGIGPLLSSAKLELDSFMDEMRTEHATMPLDKLQSIREIIDSLTNDLRNLSHHLLPRLLEEFGLYSAFNNLVNRVRSIKKVNVDFYCNFSTKERFDRNTELNLYRCGQELINNAIKHSQAGEIMIQLIRHDHSIVLMVEDDGIGFNPEIPGTENAGIGLSNIDARVRFLGGDFLIDSLKDRGTTVSIEIPI
jgi:signal transduction histidine kinase